MTSELKAEEIKKEERFDPETALKDDCCDPTCACSIDDQDDQNKYPEDHPIEDIE